MNDDPTLDVAQDLTEIVRLHAELHEQAIAKADDKDMPGGDALAMLGPVANLEAWQHRLDTAERLWLNDAGPEPHIDEPDWEPPLQTLLFWTETQREIRGMDINRPTIDTEAKFLRQLLPYLTETEPRFDALAKDIHQARRRLEAILKDGERATVGVPCPRCRREGRRTSQGHIINLIRTEHDRSRPRGCNGHGHLPACPVYPKAPGFPTSCNCGDRGGLIEQWACPGCQETYDLSHYNQEVTRDYIAHADYLELKHLPRRIEAAKPGTVKVWANRGHVKTRTNQHGDQTYCIADIEARLAQTDEVA